MKLPVRKRNPRKRWDGYDYMYVRMFPWLCIDMCIYVYEAIYVSKRSRLNSQWTEHVCHV